MTKTLKLSGLAAKVDQLHRSHPPGKNPTTVTYRGKTYRMGAGRKKGRKS